MAKKIVNIADYSFNAAAKTITFSGAYTGLELANIELITNLVNNEVIYQFNKPTKGGTLFGLVLTLTYDTTSMSNTDELQIFVEAQFLTTPINIVGTPTVELGSTSLTALENINVTVSNEVEIKNYSGNPVPISASSLPLPTEASTSALQTAGNTSLSNIDTKTPSLGQTTMVNSSPVVIASNQSAIPISGTIEVTGVATESTLATRLSESDFDTKIGSLTETAPTTDIASSGLNGRLQRIAQRITSLITALGSPFQAGGSIGNTAFGVNNGAGASAVNIQDGGNTITVDGTVGISGTVPISSSSLPLPTGASSSTLQTTGNTSLNNIDTKIPSGLTVTTGRLQVELPSGGGGLTNTELRATPVPISGTVTTNIGGTIFIQSAGNSSTAQLTAGSTFTGTVENLLTGKSLVVSVRSDQPLSINIIQYIDAAGTQIVSTTTFTRLANVPLNEAIQINGNYVKITVQNTGVASTTNLVIDSWYGDMQPFPTSLTNNGNFKVAIAENSSRNKTGQYALSSFRTLGTAATPQNIFTLENPLASTKKIAIKKLEILMDTTAALATVSPSIKLSRLAALPTGGTTLTTTKWNTTDATAVGISRGGTASDGGVATAITATAGRTIYTRLVDRLHTAAGFVSHNSYDLLENIGITDPLILNANEAILIQGVLANAATTHFVVNIVWEEYI